MDRQTESAPGAPQEAAGSRGDAGTQQNTSGTPPPRSRNVDSARNAVPPQEVPPSKEDLQKQYDLIVKSLDYLSLALAAVLLNYYTVDVQRQQVLAVINEKADPYEELDLFPFQVSSAVMLLSSASFFFGVSQDAIAQPQTDPVVQRSMQINNYINASVLAAAAARIYNLFLVKFAPHPQPETPVEEEEEEEVELEDSLL